MTECACMLSKCPVGCVNRAVLTASHVEWK